MTTGKVQCVSCDVLIFESTKVNNLRGQSPYQTGLERPLRVCDSQSDYSIGQRS
ncbi:MAG: hypothetical protein ACI9SP_004826 [Arenicella sp.]|jgi:hypothetical protein